MAGNKNKSVSVDNKLNLKFKGIRFTSGDLSYFLPLKLNNFEKWFADFVLPSILRSRYTKDSPEIQNILQVGDWNSVIGALRFYYEGNLTFTDVLSDLSGMLTYRVNGLETKLLSNDDFEYIDIMGWLNFGGAYKFFDGNGFSEYTDYDPNEDAFYEYVMYHNEKLREEWKKRAMSLRDVVHLAMNKFLYSLYSFFSFGNGSVQVQAVFEEVPLNTYFTYDDWSLTDQLSPYGFETVAYVKTPTQNLEYNLHTNPAHWGMLYEYKLYGLLSYFPIIFEGGYHTTDVVRFTMNYSWGESEDEFGTLEEFFGSYSGFRYSIFDEKGVYVGNRELPFVEGLNLSEDAYNDLMRKSLDNSETVKNFVKQVGDIGETDHHVHLVPALKDVKISEDGKKLELWVEYDYVDTSNIFEFAEYITF